MPTQNALQSWLDDVAGYERAFKKWETRVDKILKRYRDESRDTRSGGEVKYNVLWSNVQTLASATFARLPKPDVFRAHRDLDPVARVASMLLERCLDYHIQHYKQYRSALRACVLDRFLGGRGTAWVRYEPHFRAARQDDPVDGPQVSEDVDMPGEELDYECVAVDYVHYRDFGHSVARSWEEVTRVWRKVYMTRQALSERFGEELAARIPMDADGTQLKREHYGAEDALERATVYEGWDKAAREAVWFSRSAKRFLDRRPDPVGFEDVFPCARPLYATLTNDSLVPVPDYTVYQDQAQVLDLLADKIDGLVKALKLSGGYDASVPELARIFTEAENGALIPVKNWAAFAEKNGLQGALSLVDLKPIADALLASYQAFEMVKGGIDELTGISDVMRGQTAPSETATAQQLKSNYGSMRLKDYQDQVSVYASELLNLMAQVICMKFSAQTIAQVGGAQQLSEADRQYVPQAIELLIGPERMADPEAAPAANPARDFRVEVSTDSMVYLDEQQEKQSRVEFLGAVSAYLKGTIESLVQMPPELRAAMVPLLMDMLKFGVAGYKVGRGIEGAFDALAERLKELAAQPPQPQVPPEVQVAQLRAQLDQQRLAGDVQLERERAQNQFQLDAAKVANDMQLAREKQADETELARSRMAMENEQHAHKMQLQERESQDAIVQSVKEAFAAHRGMVEQALAKDKAERDAREAKAQGRSQGQGDVSELGKAIAKLVRYMAAPRRLVRGADGRPEGVQLDLPQEEEQGQEQQQALATTGVQVQEELAELGAAIQKLVEQIGAPRRVIRGADGRAEMLQ